MPGVTADRACPKCSGKMWDNTASKKSPKAPDYVCKDRDNCDGAVWLKKEEKAAAPRQEPKPVVPLADISKEYLATVLWVAKQLAKVDSTELPSRPTFADAQAVAATAYIQFRKQG